MRREVPFAFLAFGLCAAADYAASEYAFSHYSGILLQYTGFKDGIYVNPGKYAPMKASFQNTSGRVYVDNDDDLLDGE